MFGVARLEALPELNRFGVTSFDSASFLRKAWLGASSNYLTLGGPRYAALRVRFSKDNPTLELLEQRALQHIRTYSGDLQQRATILESLHQYEWETLCNKLRTQLSTQPDASHIVSETVEEILKGTRLTKEQRLALAVKHALTKPQQKLLEDADKGMRQIRRLRSYYEMTLTDMPWTLCDCPICRTVNIEVIIFRGNNRNRRRGFHNTHVFYNQFKQHVPRILVFTNCTMRKDNNPNLLPSYQRYRKSPSFAAFWNHIYYLPVEVGILSAKYGLISWDQRIPDYNYKMQQEDVSKFVYELQQQLQHFDKIFFIGLGLYREVVTRVYDDTGFPIEIFPKHKHTTRDRLDIIEYNKQLKFLRAQVEEYLPPGAPGVVQKPLVDF